MSYGGRLQRSRRRPVRRPGIGGIGRNQRVVSGSTPRRAAVGRSRTGSQGLWWWLAIVLLAIVVAAIISWFQDRAPSVPDGFSEQAEAATLVRVVDGDTIVVELSGAQERVRLLNIDTPETVHPQHGAECGGPEASERVSELVQAGDHLVLEFDHQRRDRYDRLLAGVYADEVFINELLAREGWGEPTYYAPNERFLDQIESAWQAAEREGAGLFSDSLGCLPH